MKKTVDCLTLTATPIPRTLALTVHGDLDVSILDELPPGRTPVKTVYCPNDERGTALAALEEAIEEYRLFLRTGAEDGRIRANLGAALIRTGRIEEGEEEMRRGVRVSPDLPGPALLLADRLAETGRTGEAIAVLRKAAERIT